MKQTKAYNDGDKNHKTRRTMNFTQNNLFFVYKEKFLDNFFAFHACMQRYAKIHAAKNENKWTTKWLPDMMQYKPNNYCIY